MVLFSASLDFIALQGSFPREPIVGLSKTAREAKVPSAWLGVEEQFLPRDATAVVLPLVSRERFDDGCRLLPASGPTGGSRKSPSTSRANRRLPWAKS